MNLNFFNYHLKKFEFQKNVKLKNLIITFEI